MDSPKHYYSWNENSVSKLYSFDYIANLILVSSLKYLWIKLKCSPSSWILKPKAENLSYYIECTQKASHSFQRYNNNKKKICAKEVEIKLIYFLLSAKYTKLTNTAKEIIGIKWKF